MTKLARQISALYCLIIIIGMSDAVDAQYRVIGYYPMWTRTTLPASSVRFDVLTHINHAFAWPNADGSIASDDGTIDTALINATHRAGRKILLSFGGAGGIQTANFDTVAAYSTLRGIFINNVVSRLATYHYDGADLDWEGPSSRADKANEVTLVQELRAAFQAADTSWLITMAIGPSNWSGQWRDFAALTPYVNWFNAMEYDFHGSWSSVAGHNGPLYLGSDPNTDPDAYSIDLSVQYLSVTRAIPKSKLVLGLPFYGKSFGTSVLYSSFSGEQDLAYRDILSAVQTGAWTRNWDNGSQVPYYTSTSPPELITFDDSSSIAIKCQYVKNQGLSGVMIWELSQDVIGQSQPLLDAIATQMTTTGIVAQRQPATPPTGFVLYDNYPNPFNPSTTIMFAIPIRTNVSLKIFDVLGREVKTLVNEFRNAGIGTARFDASERNLAAGVYFVRLQGGGFTQAKKMILTK